MLLDTNGVWTEALETSYLGRSGGVAILAKDPILAVKGKGKYDHRWVSTILPYTRTRAMHVHCIYGWDRTYEDDGRNAELSQRIQEEISKNGRVPYIVGGDWNQTPEEVAEHWRKNRTPKGIGEPTGRFGREIDWFMVTPSFLGATAHSPDE